MERTCATCAEPIRENEAYQVCPRCRRHYHPGCTCIEHPTAAMTPGGRIRIAAPEIRLHPEYTARPLRWLLLLLFAVVVAGVVLYEPEKTHKPEKNLENHSPVAEETLHTKELRAWRAFLGYDVEVPPPPEELIRTLKQAKEKGFTTFDAHYIPPLDVSENALYPGWKIKPSSVYYVRDYKNFYNPPTKIGGYWCIVDNIKRPNNRVYSLQDEYIGDPLVHILTDLRETGKIADFERRNSRFNTSWGEVYTIILPKIAEELGVARDKVRLPTYWEFNILGNLYYPYWGQAGSAEWTEDTLKPERNHGSAGSGNYGGLANYPDYYYHRPNNHDRAIGFRPMIVFSPINYGGDVASGFVGQWSGNVSQTGQPTESSHLPAKLIPKIRIGPSWIIEPPSKGSDNTLYPVAITIRSGKLTERVVPTNRC